MRKFLSDYPKWLLMPIGLTAIIGAVILLTVGKIWLIWTVILGGGLAGIHHYMAANRLAKMVILAKDKSNNAQLSFGGATRLFLMLAIFAGVAKVSREALYTMAGAFVGGYVLILLAMIRYELRRLG